MKPPRCHKEPMVHWSHDDGKEKGRRTRYYLVWRCQTCKRELELYRWPWTWFWLRVRYDDLHDEVVTKAWWLGAVGSLASACRDEMVFTVMPLNRLIHSVVKLYNWFRYCNAEGAIEYRKGLHDGAVQERARMRAKLQRLDEKAMNAGLEWRQLGDDIPDKATGLLEEF